jgi:predicted DsbA family dithiol-disulfide isomerase
MAPISDTVTVDMFLDVSCPWCHGALGTNRRVLDEFAADPALPHLDVRWRFMRLYPMPRAGGLPIDEYYATWGDDPARAIEAARADVRAFVASVGARVDYDRYTFLHDPLTAHRLLAIVRDDGGDDLPDLWSLSRVIWSANFVDGIDISDPGALRASVDAGGLQLPERVWDLLADPTGHHTETLTDHERALEVGLDGVPRMVVAGRIVPTWIAPDTVRAQLRAAILEATGRTR